MAEGVLNGMTVYFVLNFKQIYELVIEDQMDNQEYLKSVVVIRDGHFVNDNQ